MTTATDHARTLLAAIIPARRDLLDRALRDLTPEQFPDRILANLFTMLERYSEITGSVITRDALADLLSGSRADAGTIAIYQETYDELHDLAADDTAFRWSLEQIRELAADRETGGALTEAMEILTRGAKGEKGETLRGHHDARAHVLSRFADIDRNLSMQDAPEGDMRDEGKDILADYAATELARAAGRGLGINFGVPALDERIGGLHPGLCLIVGYSSDGKSQPLTAPVLTPSGWKMMGELQVGDHVVDPLGQPSQVRGIFKQGTLPVYRLTFSDGSTAEASGDHLWSVRAWRNVRERQVQPGVRGRQAGKHVPLILTTEQLRGELLSSRRNPVLVKSEGLSAVDLGPGTSTALGPYGLGLLLGDGGGFIVGASVTFTNPVMDSQLLRDLELELPSGMVLIPQALDKSCPTFRLVSVEGRRTKRNPLIEVFKELGLRGVRGHEKFVPESYKWASAKDRLAVLQGLMDTDGCHERGRATFSSASKQLRDDVVWLARSLGLRAAPVRDKTPTYSYKGEKRTGRISYGCSVWETDEIRVFRLERKRKRLGSRDAGRAIVSIEYVRDAECQCISVTAASSLYVTEDFVPTHNTSLCVQLAWSASVEQGKNVVFLTTETPRGQVRRRMIARHSCLPAFGDGDGLNSRDIRDGTLTVEERERFEQTVLDFNNNPAYGRAYICQVPRGASIGYVESKLLRIARQFPVDLVIMDYLALLRPDRKRTTDREELSGTLKGAKQITTTFNDGAGVPFVSPWQVSRTARADAERTGHYTLSALSETAETSNSSDQILSLLAPLDNDSRRAKIKAQVMKHRDGTKANSIELMVDYATSKFTGGHQTATVIDNMFDPLGSMF